MSEDAQIWLIIIGCGAALCTLVMILAAFLPRGMATPIGTVVATFGYAIWASEAPDAIGGYIYVIWTPLVGFIAYYVAKSAAFVVDTIRA